MAVRPACGARWRAAPLQLAALASQSGRAASTRRLGRRLLPLPPCRTAALASRPDTSDIGSVLYGLRAGCKAKRDVALSKAGRKVGLCGVTRWTTLWRLLLLAASAPAGSRSGRRGKLAMAMGTKQKDEKGQATIPPTVGGLTVPACLLSSSPLSPTSNLLPAPLASAPR